MKIIYILLLSTIAYSSNLIVLDGNCNSSTPIKRDNGIRDEWSSKPLNIDRGRPVDRTRVGDREYTHANDSLGNNSVAGRDESYISYQICKNSIKANSEKSYDIGFNLGKSNADIQIGKMLYSMEDELNILFPIKKLYIEGILEPPTIAENTNKKIYDNGQTYVSYEKKYSIIRKEHFVQNEGIKDWRNMLLSYDKDYYLNSDKIKPTTDINLDLTIDDICNGQIKKFSEGKFYEGYKDGQEEINVLYLSRLKNLEKYLNSLYLYNRLYIEKKIEPPLIGNMDSRVISSGDSLTINERYMKILEYSHFNDEVKKWRTYIINHSKIREVIK